MGLLEGGVGIVGQLIGRVRTETTRVVRFRYVLGSGDLAECMYSKKTVLDTNKRNCLQKKIFPEPQGVVEAPGLGVSPGLQRWELATRSQKEMGEAMQM